MIPQETGYSREKLIPKTVMVKPLLWLLSGEGADVTGHRLLAIKWDAARGTRRPGRGERPDCMAATGCADGVALRGPGRGVALGRERGGIVFVPAKSDYRLNAPHSIHDRSASW